MIFLQVKLLILQYIHVRKNSWNYQIYLWKYQFSKIKNPNIVGQLRKSSLTKIKANLKEFNFQIYCHCSLKYFVLLCFCHIYNNTGAHASSEQFTKSLIKQEKLVHHYYFTPNRPFSTTFLTFHAFTPKLALDFLFLISELLAPWRVPYF